MVSIAEYCMSPFIDLLRHFSDYPVTLSAFVSVLIGLAMQDVATAFIAFGISLAFLAVLYVVTFGRAFGRGGLKRDVRSRT